jgi:hypothetical protein
MDRGASVERRKEGRGEQVALVDVAVKDRLMMCASEQIEEIWLVRGYDTFISFVREE